MKKHQTTFAYPVEKICGKVSKNSRVIHACTASGKQTTYLQGQRDKNAHPVTEAEIGRMSLFARRTKAAGARLNKKASTYEADLAAYRAQLSPTDGSTPIPTFQSYIWSLIKSEITE